jgi:hypothetical protein
MKDRSSPSGELDMALLVRYLGRRFAKKRLLLAGLGLMSLIRRELLVTTVEGGPGEQRDLPRRPIACRM